MISIITHPFPFNAQELIEIVMALKKRRTARVVFMGEILGLVVVVVARV